VAEEEDRRRHHGRGDSTEDRAVDVRSGPFRHRAILIACAAGSGERDRPAGTSEHTDRASDLLKRERESECCCQNRSGLASAERERVVSKG
jgi:hypothetical protein